MPLFLLTVGALVAFAGNSLLCRMALAERAIDATAFTAIRLCSGAIVLLLLCRLMRGHVTARPRVLQPLRWRNLAAPAALFLYALPFSLAYVRLGASTGALLLFGAVQLTLLAIAARRGERPRASAWFGFAMALYGLGWLCGPSARQPDLVGVVLMAGAGVAWATYTVLGRGGLDSLAANAHAFTWSSLPALLVVAVTPGRTPTCHGAMLAVLSGAFASALGYAIWYRVLPRLPLATAAFAQLAVPPLTATGGVLWLGEPMTQRVAGASALVLGGVALAVWSRRSRRMPEATAVQ